MSLFAFLSSKKKDPYTRFNILIDNPFAKTFDEKQATAPLLKTNEYDITHFFTRVVEVTSDNEDGTRRQQIIQKCKRYEPLDLVPDPENSSAIRVRRTNGEHIGTLPADQGEWVHEKLQVGYSVGAYITNITGGYGNKKILGANLIVVVAEPGMSNTAVQNYLTHMDLQQDQN